MELTPMDLNGDGYVETGAYVAPDGSIPYVQIDSDFDQVADVIMADTNGNGVVDIGSYDDNEDGVPEATGSIPEYPASAQGGTSFVITGHSYDVSGASGAAVALDGLQTQMIQGGGQAVTIDPMAPQPYDQYDIDSDGDGYVDALDRTPTLYGEPTPYGS